MTILAAAAGWVALGIFGFAFWWTRNNDLTFAEIPLMMMAGFMGPAAFIAGAIIHGPQIFGGNRVLIRRRR